MAHLSASSMKLMILAHLHLHHSVDSWMWDVHIYIVTISSVVRATAFQSSGSFDMSWFLAGEDPIAWVVESVLVQVLLDHFPGLLGYSNLVGRMMEGIDCVDLIGLGLGVKIGFTCPKLLLYMNMGTQWPWTHTFGTLWYHQIKVRVLQRSVTGFLKFIFTL